MRSLLSWLPPIGVSPSPVSAASTSLALPAKPAGVGSSHISPAEDPARIAHLDQQDSTRQTGTNTEKSDSYTSPAPQQPNSSDPLKPTPHDLLHRLDSIQSDENLMVYSFGGVIEGFGKYITKGEARSAYWGVPGFNLVFQGFETFLDGALTLYFDSAEEIEHAKQAIGNFLISTGNFIKGAGNWITAQRNKKLGQMAAEIGATSVFQSTANNGRKRNWLYILEKGGWFAAPFIYGAALSHGGSASATNTALVLGAAGIMAIAQSAIVFSAIPTLYEKAPLIWNFHTHRKQEEAAKEQRRELEQLQRSATNDEPETSSKITAEEPDLFEEIEESNEIISLKTARDGARTLAMNTAKAIWATGTLSMTALMGAAVYAPPAISESARAIASSLMNTPIAPDQALGSKDVYEVLIQANWDLPWFMIGAGTLIMLVPGIWGGRLHMKELAKAWRKRNSKHNWEKLAKFSDAKIEVKVMERSLVGASLGTISDILETSQALPSAFLFWQPVGALLKGASSLISKVQQVHRRRYMKRFWAEAEEHISSARQKSIPSS